MNRTVIVCGGRDYRNQATVRKALDDEHRAAPIGLVVHGGAKGADALADDWAMDRGIARAHVLPDWTKHGRSAGPRRNQEMLDLHPEAERVIAFPGGRGTSDMKRRAACAGVLVVEVTS